MEPILWKKCLPEHKLNVATRFATFKCCRTCAITTLRHCKEMGVGYLYLVILESVLIVVIFKIKLNVATDIPVAITLRLSGARE